MIGNKYTIFLFIAIIISSIATVTNRFVIKTFSDPISYFVIFALSANITLIALHVARFRLSGVGKTMKNDWKILLLISATYVVSYVMLYISMELNKISLVTAIFMMHALIATVLGGKFFHESHLSRNITAAAIVIVGALMIVV